MFTKGHKYAKGGARANAGRDPDWLKKKCQDAVSRKKLIEFLSDVAEGKNVSFSVTMSGEVVPCPPSVKDRIAATNIILERGFGKVAQQLEHSGSVTLESLLGSTHE